MNRYQLIALAIMAAFYAVYFGKLLSQKKKGIRTDQIARGKSDRKRFTVEIIMKAATICVVPVEMASILIGRSVLRYSGKLPGIVLGILGVLLFVTAVITMADSWRAGIAEKDRTKFVCSGIFQISRNPAFLGFDLVYAGILLMFFNWLLAAVSLWAAIMLHLQILQEEKYLPTVFGEEYVTYRKKVCRYFGRKNWKYFAALAAVIVLAVGGYAAYGKSQMAKIPQLSLEDMIAYTTGNNPDAVITVGMIRDGEASWKVYGENGKELEHKAHTYEIGSLTKTVTAACIAQAVLDGKIALADTVDRYLDLPEGNAYPTIEGLLTHTSGFKGYYFETPMIMNFLADRNSFYNISGEMVKKRLERLSVPAKEYGFTYSNFGYAVLGQVLESVYKEDYAAIINRFLRENIGLTHTSFTREKGDLGNYWNWNMDDAYASAGALTSDIEDMLAYAQFQLQENELTAMTHRSLKTINASSESYRAMGIFMDEIGMAWIHDCEHGIIWHNGGTDDYNCYLGFNVEDQTAVVILSNLPGGYRIPATVMGVAALREGIE